jgi:hypothetical protein
MKELKTDLYGIKDKELRLQSLVEESNKQELAQCVRLISMYVSMYKKQFGELPVNCYQEILSAGDVDEASAGIFAGGLNEAIDMMDAVIRSNIHKENTSPGKITIN